jgi:hypothetical protein
MIEKSRIQTGIDAPGHGILQGIRYGHALSSFEPPADYKSAIQQIANLRYGHSGLPAR